MGRLNTTAPRPVVRKMHFDFDDAIPKYWIADNKVATHVANGLNLLFPPGERFFVRSVRAYLDKVDDPDLKARAKDFFGQEGAHAREHQRYNEILREHGLRIDDYLRFYEFVAYSVIEPMAPPSLRLAVTAACEHYTATFARHALQNAEFQLAHPKVRELLLWHAAEEIEHKSVAFEVMKTAGVSERMRVAGMLLATATLGGFWVLGSAWLMATDPEMTLPDLVRDYQRLAARRSSASLMREAVGEYLRRDFHPDQHDDYYLAEAYLRSVGRLAA